MKKIIIYTLMATVSLFFFSCEKKVLAKHSYDTNLQFTWGFVEFYGDYYSNYDIKSNVSSLHLFTEGLSVVNGQLSGSGQYLIVEDIFSHPTDTLIPQGVYLPAETGEPFTFFGGKFFTDNQGEHPAGIYINYIQSELNRIESKIIPKGEMNIDITNDSIYHIQLSMTNSDDVDITGDYKGVLHHFDRLLSKPKSGVSMFLKRK